MIINSDNIIHQKKRFLLTKNQKERIDKEECFLTTVTALHLKNLKSLSN